MPKNTPNNALSRALAARNVAAAKRRLAVDTDSIDEDLTPVPSAESPTDTTKEKRNEETDTDVTNIDESVLTDTEPDAREDVTKLDPHAARRRAARVARRRSARRKVAFAPGDTFTFEGATYMRDDSGTWHNNDTGMGLSVDWTDDEVQNALDQGEGTVKTARRRKADVDKTDESAREPEDRVDPEKPVSNTNDEEGQESQYDTEDFDRNQGDNKRKMDDGNTTVVPGKTQSARRAARIRAARRKRAGLTAWQDGSPGNFTDFNGNPITDIESWAKADDGDEIVAVRSGDGRMTYCIFNAAGRCVATGNAGGLFGDLSTAQGKATDAFMQMLGKTARRKSAASPVSVDEIQGLEMRTAVPGDVSVGFDDGNWYAYSTPQDQAYLLNAQDEDSAYAEAQSLITNKTSRRKRAFNEGDVATFKDSAGGGTWTRDADGNWTSPDFDGPMSDNDVKFAVEDGGAEVKSNDSKTSSVKTASITQVIALLDAYDSLGLIAEGQRYNKTAEFERLPAAIAQDRLTLLDSVMRAAKRRATSSVSDKPARSRGMVPTVAGKTRKPSMGQAATPKTSSASSADDFLTFL